MEDRGSKMAKRPLLHPPSSILHPRLLSPYAASASGVSPGTGGMKVTPPGMFVLTGAEVGPAWPRGLYQLAQSQTVDPPGTSAGRTTSILFVRLACPSSFQSFRLAG